MRKLLISAIGLGLLSIPSVAQFRLPNSPPPTPKLIRAGRLLEVRNGKYISDQGILTDGEHIKEVGPWEQTRVHAPKDVIIIDLSKATVLPGLIDCHSHLLVSMPPEMSGGESITTAVALMSPEFRTLLGARNAREYLEAGVTAVRVVGHSGITGDIALRDGIRSGLVPGPRMQASGRKITPPGGQAIWLLPALAKPILEQEYVTVSGPEEARKAVRENLAMGANLVKIVIGAGAGPLWKFRYLASEDVKAITEDAHRLGMKVAAHVADKVAIQTAIDGGVDSIEHAFEATDAQLQQMKDKGIFLVATDIPDDGVSSPQYKGRLQRALKIGVKIAMGSDLWFPFSGKTYGQSALLELGALHEEGMSNAEVIRSATMNGAELMGWSDLMGEIAAGKLADLIAVSEDPLQDVTSLQHARL
jgi:imidazolonepropionase-like amidohydrolase